MKISRNKLRKIVETTINEQQSSITSTTPKKTRAPAGGERAIKTDIEGFVKSVIDDVVGDKSINVMVTVGRSSILVTRLTGDASDMRKEIKRALKDDPDLSVARKDLKRMKGIKVVYDKAEGAGSGSADSSVVELPPSAVKKAPSAGGSKKNCDDALAGHFAIDVGVHTGGPPPKKVTVSDPEAAGAVLVWQMPGDTSYRYMIGDERWGTHPPEGVDHGCWYAQNMKTCKVFSLKGNDDAIGILNRTFDIVGYKCGETPSDPYEGEFGAAPKTPGEVIPSPGPSPSPSPGAGSLKNDAIVVLMAHGTGGSRGQMMLTAYEQGTENYYKEVIRIGDENGITVDKAYKMFVDPEEHLHLNPGGAAAYHNAKNAGKTDGEMLDAVFAAGADFDVPGFDSAYDKYLFSDLRAALNRKYGSNLGALKESRESKKMEFGKSRGTLLREKYWGRY